MRGKPRWCRPGLVAASDHPRACGANVPADNICDAATGSSPRMRGKQRSYRKPRDLFRIIPAHAGQTRWRPRILMSRPDHPRACGANYPEYYELKPKAGSSPRMRGKHNRRTYLWSRERIIPAHAGQTRCPSESFHRGPDHPRACGANLTYVHWDTSIHGSSPRMRGKHLFQDAPNNLRRIIPAHAGQTGAGVVTHWGSPDHPRACGANLERAWKTVMASGSSPRMRGKRLIGSVVHDAHRIIPAHAGQTHRLEDRRRLDADHPRACGANSTAS